MSPNHEKLAAGFGPIKTPKIVGKIEEVDAVLRANPRLQHRVREVHPEVSFSEWNKGQPMRFQKKTAAGRDERRALVDDHFGAQAFERTRNEYLVKQVGTDDILDAFAALWTAERIWTRDACSLPENPPRDSKGLRMEIVY